MIINNKIGACNRNKGMTSSKKNFNNINNQLDATMTATMLPADAIVPAGSIVGALYHKL